MGPGLDGDQGLSQHSSRLHGRPRLQLSLLLSGPLGWLVIAYLGSLAVLFVAAFWHLDSFSGEVVKDYSFAELRDAVEGDVYRTIALRTVGDRRGGDGDRRADRVPDRVLHGEGRDAADARAARRRGADAAVVELPREGLRVAHDPRGGRDPQLGARAVRPARAGLRQRRHLARLLLPLAAVHDPPVYAGLERIPDSLLDASGDLGGGRG